MSQTYIKRQREAAAKAPAGPAPEQAAPALAGLQESGFEEAVDAIQNVEPHAGRQLSLDDAMAGRMEQQFGIRMDQVELRESPQVEQMDARAFAKGNVVQFAPGQFRPDTEQGRQLIQHELGHVVQQARGGVRADMPGMNLNTDEGLEHQADLGNLSAGGGAPMSLGSLNAETAPMQGGFFDKIKNFFQKKKKLEISAPTEVTHKSGQMALYDEAQQRREAARAEAEKEEDPVKKRSALQTADKDYYNGIKSIVRAMPEDMLRGDQAFQQRVVGEASSVANRELGELAADKPNARWGEISTAAFRGGGGNMIQPVVQTMFSRMMGEENIKNAFEADDPEESINQVGKLARDSGVLDLLRQSQEQSFEGLNFEGLSEEGKSRMTMQNFYTRAVSAIAANKDVEKAKAAQRRLNMKAGTGQFIDEQDATIMGWTSGAGRKLMNSLAETPAPAQPAALEAPSLPSISLAEGPNIGPMPSAGPALRAPIHTSNITALTPKMPKLTTMADDFEEPELADLNASLSNSGADSMPELPNFTTSGPETLKLTPMPDDVLDLEEPELADLNVSLSKDPSFDKFVDELRDQSQLSHVSGPVDAPNITMPKSGPALRANVPSAPAAPALAEREAAPAKVTEPEDADSNSVLKVSDNALEKTAPDESFEPGSNGVSSSAPQVPQTSMPGRRPGGRRPQYTERELEEKWAREIYKWNIMNLPPEKRAWEQERLEKEHAKKLARLQEQYNREMDKISRHFAKYKVDLKTSDPERYEKQLTIMKEKQRRKFKAKTEDAEYKYQRKMKPFKKANERDMKRRSED